MKSIISYQGTSFKIIFEKEFFILTNIISINKQPLSVKKYKGNMVVTFKDIDTVHGRPNGTARKRFNDNKQHFIEGEDYFVRKTDEAKSEYGIIAPNGLVLITESGYLMLAKSFTDDLAWKVQRELVNRYFKAEEEVKPYEYFDKTYNGEPVLTSVDVEYLTKVKCSTIDAYLKRKAEIGKDYYFLAGDELKNFKAENPKLSKNVCLLYIVTRIGFIRLCSAYGIKVEQPKCFENKKPPKVSGVKRALTKMRESYDIRVHDFTKKNAEACGLLNDYCVNQEITVRQGDTYHIFADSSAPLEEYRYLVAEGLGRILAGQLQKDADPQINYDQDARVFAMVLMALSFYFDGK